MICVTPDGVRDWGKHAHGSPLYAHLVGVIAADAELIRVLNRIEHLPQVNLLLGGVHYLLMGTADQGLAAWYGSLVDNPRPAEDIDPVFRSFVLEHEDELVELGNTRYTLPAILERLPSGEPVIVMNAFTFGQFTLEGRARVEEICDIARTSRPVYRVSMEILDGADEWARLSVASEGAPVQIGQAHPHGEWVEFWDQARP